MYYYHDFQVIDSEVKVLLELKQEFKEATNIAWTPKFNPDVDLCQNSATKSTSKAEAKKPVSQPKQVQNLFAVLVLILY